MERLIDVSDTQSLGAVFGEYDGNMKAVEEEFGVKVITRDSAVKISGDDEANIEKAEKVNQALKQSIQKLDKKISLAKRSSTPKITMSANRNYGIGNNHNYNSNIITSRTLNTNHNTPQRNVSSSNYYYSKYINNSQKNASKSYTSINSVIDHNSNRSGAKTKRMKLPNK